MNCWHKPFYRSVKIKCMMHVYLQKNKQMRIESHPFIDSCWFATRWKANHCVAILSADMIQLKMKGKIACVVQMKRKTQTNQTHGAFAMELTFNLMISLNPDWCLSITLLRCHLYICFKQKTGLTFRRFSGCCCRYCVWHMSKLTSIWSEKPF